jgi:hypothetical protein
MPLRGPTAEDERKLHAEINQIGNQRFILTTLALTLFGILIAWMVPKDTPSPGADVGTFPFIVSAVLSILLFGIYLWSHLLKNTMRVFTYYLVETKKSGWEQDWIEFRRDPHFAHTKPQTLIFLLLNAIGVGFPFLLSWIYSLKISSIAGPITAVGVGVATELMIYLMGFQAVFDAEAKIANRWKRLNNSN